MGDLLQPWHLLVLFFVFSVYVTPIRVLPFWFICKKAGFSPWLSLLYLIPFGGLVLDFVLAFSGWNVVPPHQRGWTTQPPWTPQIPSPPQS
ncbi:MAG: hypothetical protein ABSF28_12875 [Terracidiphilus sp.]|jgi:hypothetical protein